MAVAKRLINCGISITACNLKCKYCYVTQYADRQPQKANFLYPVEQICKAFSAKRLGGACIFNLCGAGETLMVEELPEIVEGLTKEGHYIEIVTNATLTKQLEKMLSLPTELLEHIEFKCSFHYLELKRLGLLEQYAKNVNMIWEKGASASVELMPNDELIPLIPEIKAFCMENFGALCHLTVGRNDPSPDKEILTDKPLDEYENIWNEFDSDMFRFKLSVFGKKRNEFCYAGDWSLFVDLTTGITKKCYKTKKEFNIYENIDAPIDFEAVGNHCPEPHCFNAHAYLTLGNIPALDTPTYAQMRDRVKEDGSHWINDNFRSFIDGKFKDENKEYGAIKKMITNIKSSK